MFGFRSDNNHVYGERLFVPEEKVTEEVAIIRRQPMVSDECTGRLRRCQVLPVTAFTARPNLLGDATTACHEAHSQEIWPCPHYMITTTPTALSTYLSSDRRQHMWPVEGSQNHGQEILEGRCDGSVPRDMSSLLHSESSRHEARRDLRIPAHTTG